jgi:hypothetical protein
MKSKSFFVFFAIFALSICFIYAKQSDKPKCNGQTGHCHGKGFPSVHCHEDYEHSHNCDL